MKPYRHYWLVFAAPCVLALACGGGARADNRDHDRAREAVAAGEALPLRTILERVEKEHPGQVMEVELERKNGVWIYEIKVLRSGGALVKLKLKAKDGALIDGSERKTARGKEERSRKERR
jgi:uncharacterized membrane protein YkoI